MNKRKFFIVVAIVIVLIGFGYSFSIAEKKADNLPMEEFESHRGAYETEAHFFMPD